MGPKRKKPLEGWTNRATSKRQRGIAPILDSAAADEEVDHNLQDGLFVTGGDASSGGGGDASSGGVSSGYEDSGEASSGHEDSGDEDPGDEDLGDEDMDDDDMNDGDTIDTDPHVLIPVAEGICGNSTSEYTCGERLGNTWTTNFRGPQNERLCKSCGNRHHKYRQDPSRSGHDWRKPQRQKGVRTPRGPRKKPKAKNPIGDSLPDTHQLLPVEDGMCENSVEGFQCPRKASSGRGPQDERLCIACKKRFKDYQDSPAGTREPHDWRKPKGPGRGGRKGGSKLGKGDVSRGKMSTLGGGDGGDGGGSEDDTDEDDEDEEPRKSTSGRKRPHFSDDDEDDDDEDGVPRKPKSSRKESEDPAARCANRVQRYKCSSVLVGNTSEEGPGPDGKKLCGPCYRRYRQWLKVESWRTPKNTHGGPLELTKHCGDCGTTVWLSEEDAENTLCDSCEQRRAVDGERRPYHNNEIKLLPQYSHTDLIKLAVQQRTQLRPAGEGFDPVERYGGNYRFIENHTLRKIVGERDIARSYRGTSRVMINWLQIEDALNGLLPRAPPVGASEYHGLSAEALSRRAYDRRCEIQGPRTTEALIRALLLKDLDDGADVFERVDDQYGTASISDGGMLGNTGWQTSNGGLRGSREALRNLQRTILDELYPQTTSPDAELCGPRALAGSINNWLRDRGRHQEQVDPWLLMRVWMPTFNEHDTQRENGTVHTDELQAEYEDWLNETHLRPDTPESVRNDQFTELTRVRNLDYQQMIGMLAVAAQLGHIPILGLGIVRSSNIDAQGEEQPAEAQLVYIPDNCEGHVWIHNHLQHAQGDYNHWEQFGRGVGHRRQAPNLWGILTADANIMERPNFDSGDPNFKEDVIDRLLREIGNQQTLLNAKLNEKRRMCAPCRERGDDFCQPLPNQRHCENCKDNPQDCEWPSGRFKQQIELRLAGRSDEALLQACNRELTEEELAKLTRVNGMVDGEVKGKHWAVIGCGRSSSSQGEEAIQDLLQKVIKSVQTWVEVNNNPIDQNNSEVGAGLGGLPVQRLHLAFARHGAKPVPYQQGNLMSLELLRFVAYIHHLTRPGNPQLPEEIHFLTLGIAGFAVDITAWGDRTGGWFKFILDRDTQNGTDIEYRLFYVPLVEDHVVDGIGTHCLDEHDHQRPLGPPSPHWYKGQGPVRTKNLTKHRLMDIIDRATGLRYWAMRNFFLTATGLQPLPLPPYNMPGMVGTLDKLDRIIVAMFAEKAWRSGFLTPNQAAELHSRNHNRNGVFA